MRAQQTTCSEIGRRQSQRRSGGRRRQLREHPLHVPIGPGCALAQECHRGTNGNVHTVKGANNLKAKQ